MLEGLYSRVKFNYFEYLKVKSKLHFKTRRLPLNFTKIPINFFSGNKKFL